MRDRAIDNIILMPAFFLIPFLGGNHLSLYFVNIDKFWIEGTFLICLIAAIISQAIGSNENRKPSPAFLAYMTPFFLVTVLSLGYTWNIFSSLNEVNIILWIIGCSFVYSEADKKDHLLKALVIGAFVSAVLTVIQFIVLYPNLMATLKEGKAALMVRGQAIPTSSFLYHNILGGYFAFVLPLAIFYGVFGKRIIYTVAAIAIMTGLILTTTRIGVAIALFSACGLAFIATRRRDVRLASMITGILFAGFVAAASLLYFVKGHGGDPGVLYEIKEKVRNSAQQVSTLNLRTGVWKIGYKAFCDEKLLGYGAGTFEYAFRRHFDGGVYTGHAHSTVVKTAVELGIAGLLGLLFFGVGLAVRMKGRLNEDRQKCLLISLAAGLLFSVFDFSFDVPAHVITFFVLSATFFDTTEKAPAVKAGSRKHFLPLLIVLLLLASLLFTLRTNLAAKSIDNGRSYEEMGFFKEAYLSYLDSIREMPFDNEGYIKAIRILANGYRAQAEQMKKKLFADHMMQLVKIVEKRSDKDSGLFFALALAYEINGDVDRAENYLQKAIVLYPASSRYVYEASLFYIRNGNLDKADTILNTIQVYRMNYSLSGNPQGLYLYRIKDLLADIAYRRHDFARACALAGENLDAAKRGDFVISSPKADEFISTERFIAYLTARERFFDKKLREFSAQSPTSLRVGKPNVK